MKKQFVIVADTNKFGFKTCTPTFDTKEEALSYMHNFFYTNKEEAADIAGLFIIERYVWDKELKS